MNTIIGPCGAPHQIFDNDEIIPANEQEQMWLSLQYAKHGMCSCCGKISNWGNPLCLNCQRPIKVTS
jgi:hypothetical protein